MPHGMPENGCRIVNGGRAAGRLIEGMGRPVCAHAVRKPCCRNFKGSSDPSPGGAEPIYRVKFKNFALSQEHAASEAKEIRCDWLQRIERRPSSRLSVPAYARRRNDGVRMPSSLPSSKRSQVSRLP